MEKKKAGTTGPQGSKKPLTYGSYLKVKDLLALQHPQSRPKAHDETLFIVIHQVYELWFKQILHELQAALNCIQKDDLALALRLFGRVQEIFRVLIQQVDILETMTPVEFNRFRSNINPASGFQSLQFRELEILMGADIEEYQKFMDLDPEWREVLTSRKSQPTMRSGFFDLLWRKGLIPSLKETDFSSALLKIYETNDHPTLLAICEGLLRLDEQISLWRFRHVQMVERMIGMKPGTGGSLGVAYLKGTLRKRYFSELWEIRTQMGGGLYGAGSDQIPNKSANKVYNK